jgi:HEAT repeat protein
MANHGEIEKAQGPSAQISRYLEELDSLKDGEGAVSKLVSCGPSAVEPLRRFLLEGKPGIVYHTRRFAVTALAGLGARAVLIEYLTQRKDISDPAIRLSEEAVESAAALQLVRWPSEEVYRILITIAEERCLPGALEALGELRRPEAVPALVKALEDDVCRPTAEEALRKIGAHASGALIQAAITPYPSRESEKPSSLLKRRSAAGLLAEIGVSEEEWSFLRPLLEEDDERILVSMFRIAGMMGGAKDKARAFRRLIDILQSADWYLQGEIEEALVERFETVRAIIEEEIVRRGQTPEARQNLDRIQITLRKAKYRIEQRGRDKLS